MRTQSADTHPEVERVQFDMLRKAGVAARVQLGMSLGESVMGMCWAALKEANAQATETEIAIDFIALNYGEALANAVQFHLMQQQIEVGMIDRNVLTAIEPFVEALEDLGIPYYIGGSVASMAWGWPRSTIDADIIADVQPEHTTPLVERLEAAYYIDAGMMSDAISKQRTFNIIYYGNMVKIDVFVEKQGLYDRVQRARVQQKALSQGEPNRRYNVAAPEDIILRKLDWYRQGGAVSERQWLDVLGVMKITSTMLDLTYLAEWAKKLGLADLLERALDEADLI